MTTVLDAGVRPDLAAAHADTIADLGRPGAHLTAEEKVALARVVRAARAEAEQPPWYRPSTDRSDFSELPAAAVDAAWRLTNHPGTLTADWYAAIVEQLPSPAYYVELVGLVAAVNSIDRLAAIVDVDVIPLPEPEAGDPSGSFVASSVTSHWVPIDPGASGANVLKALSSVPAAAAFRSRLIEAQYLPVDALLGDLDWTRGTLDRRQIELVAAMTSLHNECFY